jgi:hypothetical protein
MTQAAHEVEERRATRTPVGLTYWNRRRDLLYYQVVRILATRLAAEAGSVLDVGSRGSPYIEWFEDVPIRTSLDLVEPYFGEGVTSVTSDFLKWQPDRQYDIVLCLQVLEHVRDATSFARKLLAAGEVVIVSVPYRWRKAQNKAHVQDPVTYRKIVGWFGREPNFSHLVVEPETGTERIVCVFEREPRPWTSLSVRAGKHGFRPARNVPPFGEELPTVLGGVRTIGVAVRRHARQVVRRLRR